MTKKLITFTLALGFLSVAESRLANADSGILGCGSDTDNFKLTYKGRLDLRTDAARQYVNSKKPTSTKTVTQQSKKPVFGSGNRINTRAAEDHETAGLAVGTFPADKLTIKDLIGSYEVEDNGLMTIRKDFTVSLSGPKYTLNWSNYFSVYDFIEEVYSRCNGKYKFENNVIVTHDLVCIDTSLDTGIKSVTVARKALKLDLNGLKPFDLITGFKSESGVIIKKIR
jgi:hypothetical protein